MAPVKRSLFLFILIGLGGSVGLVSTFVPAHAADQAEHPHPASIADLTIPPDLGYVVETHPPTDPVSPIVIHIQEVHTNYEAQQRIVSILEGLIHRFGLRLIMVEGGFGDAGLSYLRGYGPKDNRLRVGEKYLKAGVISAEEYLDMTSDDPLTLWGVDDDRLHDQHVDAFLAAEPQQAAVKRGVSVLRDAVDALAPSLLRPELLTFNRAVSAFDAQQLDLAGYVDAITTAARTAGLSLGSYPQLTQLMTVRELETTAAREGVAHEQKSLVMKLAERLESSQLDRLLIDARQMKAGTLSKTVYYHRLRDTAEGAGLSMDVYPHLSRYVQMVIDRPAVDSMALSGELRRVVSAVRAALTTTPESRQAQSLIELVDVLEQFADFRLTPEEYRRVSDLDVAHAPDAWVAFLNGQFIAHGLPARPLQDVARLKPAFPVLQRFYHIATQRDDVLVTNTLAKLTDSGEHLAVLITGGFHSDRITRALRDRGLGVVVIAPKITQPTDERLYHAVLKYKNGHGQLSDVLAIANQPATTSR